jgi:3-ketoacyl-CoA synthase
MIGFRFRFGFKCNNMAWECIAPAHTAVGGPWAENISCYPMDIPKVLKH